MIDAAFDTAADHFANAVGEFAIFPSRSRSSVTPNGTVILRNVNGFLAIVTAKGKVFGRIGGKRRDEVQP